VLEPTRDARRAIKAAVEPFCSFSNGMSGVMVDRKVSRYAAKAGLGAGGKEAWYWAG
jgi:hypothetical protein